MVPLSSQFTITLSCDTAFLVAILSLLRLVKKSLTMSLDSSSLLSIRARCANEATTSRGFKTWPFSFLNLLASALTSFLASIRDNRRWSVSLSATSHLRGSFFSMMDSSPKIRIIVLLLDCKNSPYFLRRLTARARAVKSRKGLECHRGGSALTATLWASEARALRAL